MGTFKGHSDCPKCGSSDGKANYEDGTGYCWSCKAYFHADGTADDQSDAWDGDWTQGVLSEIKNRGLKEAVCARYGYRVVKNAKGAIIEHIAPYRDGTGRLVAQKVRGANKEFHIEGSGKDMPLFGQHLWSNGKSVVITEGEIDALSIAMAFGEGKWPAVSLPSGAQSATSAIKRALPWLENFEKIILCFDNDEHGIAARDECLPLLPPGRAVASADEV